MSRFQTLSELLRHFLHRERWVLLPLLGVLLFGAVILGVSTGLSQVAPLVYALF